MSWIAYPVSGLMVALAVAAQNTWAGWLLLMGRAPDLPLATVVAVGLSGGPVVGCFAGLVAGLLVASSQSAMFGSFLFTYMAVGILVGLMRGSVFADRVLAAMIIVAVAVPVTDLVRMILAPPEVAHPWLLASILAGPYTGVVAAPIYTVTRAIIGIVSPER